MRGFISGSLVKKMGLKVEFFKREDGARALAALLFEDPQLQRLIALGSMFFPAPDDDVAVLRLQLNQPRLAQPFLVDPEL